MPGRRPPTFAHEHDRAHRNPARRAVAASRSVGRVSHGDGLRIGCRRAQCRCGATDFRRQRTARRAPRHRASGQRRFAAALGARSKPGRNCACRRVLAGSIDADIAARRDRARRRDRRPGQRRPARSRPSNRARAPNAIARARRRRRSAATGRRCTSSGNRGRCRSSRTGA